MSNDFSISTPQPVILIYDIGKTNKKLLLFNRQYQLVYEEEHPIPGILDEDGFACDDLLAIVQWMRESSLRLASMERWDIQAINFSAYGASLVHLDENGNALTPLYNYLKPIDQSIANAFYNQFGEREIFSFQTGSPALDMLNSGLQLFWLKQTKPRVFKKIKYSLHLPQYLSFIFTGIAQADISSVGCHTGLWDVYRKQYHEWLNWETILPLLPPAQDVATSVPIQLAGKTIPAGIGMHDSTASLLPFIEIVKEPFAIVSTGTWSISLFPFFNGKLSEAEYGRDCLYYLLSKDQPVAAARLFLGNEMEQQLSSLNKFYNQPNDERNQPADPTMMKLVVEKYSTVFFHPQSLKGNSLFSTNKNLESPDIFDSYQEAYTKFMLDLAWMQKQSIDTLNNISPVSKVIVTGGFARNRIFLSYLQAFFPQLEFYTASVNNGSALGAAMAMHRQWNQGSELGNVVSLVKLTSQAELDLSQFNAKN